MELNENTSDALVELLKNKGATTEAPKPDVNIAGSAGLVYAAPHATHG